MPIFIRCPHWECSRNFRSERVLFEHYRREHDAVATVEWEYYNNLRSTGGKALVLSLVGEALYTSARESPVIWSDTESTIEGSNG